MKEHWKLSTISRAPVGSLPVMKGAAPRLKQTSVHMNNMDPVKSDIVIKFVAVSAEFQTLNYYTKKHANHSPWKPQVTDNAF